MNMDTVEVIKSRRSIKYYNSQHKMSDDEINHLLSLAVLSPTAYNIQNWRFVVVSDPELRKKYVLPPGIKHKLQMLHCWLCFVWI